ncbi:unnamed protein product [Protopolystoma xenopodis]|uniref:Uncharacterized protein n=1 Tax=Protopolystoma xenopodis TaxID=117903 RepID=A0A448WJ81_9PLAT|nr:unnamed protein product [Protopolystoma xenopodis]
MAVMGRRKSDTARCQCSCCRLWSLVANGREMGTGQSSSDLTSQRNGNSTVRACHAPNVGRLKPSSRRPGPRSPPSPHQSKNTQARMSACLRPIGVRVRRAGRVRMSRLAGDNDEANTSRRRCQLDR